jgi:acetoacetyl-CoA reductase
MFHKMTPDQWYGVINTNLNSLFNMCRPVIEGMRNRNFGRIVCISSINGQKGQAGQANYSAAKAGVVALTQSLAKEVARIGITVNVVCPGYVETEALAGMSADEKKAMVSRIPMRRFAKPEEVAAAIRFLACAEASYITGSTLKIDGGIF